MSEQNKKIARRIFEDIETNGDLSVIDEIIASDFVNHLPIGDMHGTEGAKQFFTMLRTGFPDLTSTVTHQIAEGDKVATRWISRGTHQGEIMDVSPSGNQMEITGIVISRIANGKIVEQWGNPDLLSMMQQIGAVPVPR
jgi:predicted ester cyclase